MKTSRATIVFSRFILGLTIGLGLLGSGFFTAKAIYLAKTSEHYATVKGLAEREVKANLAAWEVDYREIGNDLIVTNNQLERDQQVVVAYLKKSGFTENEMELRPAKVTDLLANPYSSSSNPVKYRYIVTGGVRIRSANVDLVEKVSQTTGELIKANVPLSFDASDYNTDLIPNPSYYYTELDKIRPEMIAEATHSASLVAQQFAKDSDSQLRGIRRASQGQFQLSSRDGYSMDTSGSMNQASSIYKKVRLVATIDYILKSGAQ